MYKKFIKRMLDLVISILGFPIFTVLYIVIGILIKIEDRGPIFYKGRRIGKNSKIFEMYKFRSMKIDAPNILNKDGSTYNSKNDDRVTKIGKFIRETSLDEIPQIINVLKGEMSLIGPRASLEETLDTYKDDEKEKMLARPGITGYTQAYYRNGLTVREKRMKDAWYAKNISFILDVKIFFKTIYTVLKKENIYTNVENDITKERKNEESITNK